MNTRFFYFKLFLLMLFSAHYSCAQKKVDNKILDFFKKNSGFQIHQFLFTTPELIELCEDSVGRKKFKSIVERSVNRKDTNKAKEAAIVLAHVNQSVKSFKTSNANENTSRDFINSILSTYPINFAIDEKFVNERFSNKGGLTDCDACISMYIFLLYDPLIYLKIRNEDISFKNNKIHFPLAYILQDCDVPIEIEQRVQLGLFERLKLFKEPMLIKISEEIRDCDLSNRCN